MESLALIEPLLPAMGSGALRLFFPSMKVRQDNRVLTDLATQLWAESAALTSNLPGFTPSTMAMGG